jgi:hypothetical protein
MLASPSPHEERHSKRDSAQINHNLQVGQFSM